MDAHVGVQVRAAGALIGFLHKHLDPADDSVVVSSIDNHNLYARP